MTCQSVVHYLIYGSMMHHLESFLCAGNDKGNTINILLNVDLQVCFDKEKSLNGLNGKAQLTQKCNKRI